MRIIINNNSSVNTVFHLLGEIYPLIQSRAVTKGAALAKHLGISKGAQLVVTQHHEQAGGTGYPLKLKGDEFVLVLAEITQASDASLVAEKVLNALKPPISIGETQLVVTTSIGISVYLVNGGDDAKKLMRKADIAMYEAKRAGRNRYYFFDANLSVQPNLAAEGSGPTVGR